jgi:small subunit ribosomal protein S1
MIEENYINANGEFDWDLFEASIPNYKTHNPKVKRHPGDNSPVYCRAPYAQELYELYNGRLEHLQEPKLGSVVQGKVVSVFEDYALVDVNWREDAMIELRKENPEYLKYIQAGFPIEVLIEQVTAPRNSSSYNIIASYSKNIIGKKREELLDSIGKPVAYLGTVTELIHGGYFVNVQGVQCFMPGSLGGMNKLVNFDELIGNSIYVVPINYSREKNYIVVSHREYLKALVPEEISKLQFGIEYDGFVTGCSRHGIFAEFNGCLTGLISRSDILPENLDNFDNQKIRPGDPIKFFIKEVIDTDKIVLSQKPLQIEPSNWDDIESRYKVPSTVTGKVKKIVRYGVFIELEPKIVGLLHKSHLSEDFELEVGQEIDVRITRIDKESKKVDFAM